MDVCRSWHILMSNNSLTRNYEKNPHILSFLHDPRIRCFRSRSRYRYGRCGQPFYCLARRQGKKGVLIHLGQQRKGTLELSTRQIHQTRWQTPRPPHKVDDGPECVRNDAQAQVTARLHDSAVATDVRHLDQMSKSVENDAFREHLTIFVRATAFTHSCLILHSYL